MSQFLKDSKILLFVFVVMSFVTAISYVDMGSEKALPASEVLTLSKPILELDRKPAAVADPKAAMMKADIFCRSKEKIRFKKVIQPVVMLDLNVCETLKSARHIWVKNETNGFKAQIFKTGEKNFRTDFIQLNIGANKVTVESVLKDGQKRVQSLEIISGS